MNRGRPVRHPDVPGVPAASSRADLVALLRVASIDAEVSRLQRSLQEILGLLERQRSDFAALGVLVAVAGQGYGGGGLAPGRSLRLRNEERAHAELAQALERHQAEALAQSVEVQRKGLALGEQRQVLLARVSPAFAGLYEAALREGRPAVTPARDGACAACGRLLQPDAGRLLREACQIVPCPGCRRLLYDPGWVERDFVPPTLRPLASRRP